MSAPQMPERLETREAAVEAVLEQLRHAQHAGRRVEADLVAQRAAGRIVERLDQPARLVREYVAGMTGEDLDGDVALVEYVRRLVELPAIPADTLSDRVDHFLEAVTREVPAFTGITRGRALDALEAPNARAAADVIDHDLTACDPDDIRHLVEGVRAARAEVGLVDRLVVGDRLERIGDVCAAGVGAVVEACDGDRGIVIDSIGDGSGAPIGVRWGSNAHTGAWAWPMTLLVPAPAAS